MQVCDLSEPSKHQIVLVLGSAPDVVLCRSWPKPAGLGILAINNAWRVRKDWDYLITPDDFPADRMPKTLSDQQKLITSRDFVPANNAFGGVFYAGGTMAFTAGYWALAALRPRVLAFLGCDMVYANMKKTHFYGKGQPDPLRDDLSLRSLEAKSARLLVHARRIGCACVRLSFGNSRLLFPSARFEELFDWRQEATVSPDPLFDQAKAREDRLGYYSASGKYWEFADAFKTADIDSLDSMWLKAAGMGFPEPDLRRQTTKKTS